MKLKDVMSSDVQGVRPDTSLAEALERLRSHDGEPLPVYEDDHVVGLLTDHQVVEWEAKGGRDLRTTTVGDVMKRDVAACYEDEDVQDALETMRDKHIDSLIVVQRPRRRGEPEQPVGVVSLSDLAQSVSTAGIATDGVLTSPPPARVFLQPIAAPSILGLYGFAGATFMVATNMAGWWGTPTSALFLFPFAAFFGGLAQFMAGMWSYRARDAVATAMHGTWGSFWMAYGLLYLLAATHTITLPTGAFPELGMWFVILAAITWVGCWGASSESAAVGLLLGLLALGSTLAAIGFFAGAGGIIVAAGWSFLLSAIVAWYTASAMMLEGAFHKIVLPLFGYNRDTNVPGTRRRHEIQYPLGQPGVKVGQ